MFRKWIPKKLCESLQLQIKMTSQEFKSKFHFMKIQLPCNPNKAKGKEELTQYH